MELNSFIATAALTDVAISPDGGWSPSARVALPAGLWKLMMINLVSVYVSVYMSMTELSWGTCFFLKCPHAKIEEQTPLSDHSQKCPN